MAEKSAADQLKELEKQQQQAKAELIKELRGPLVEQIAQLKKDLKAKEKELEKLDGSLGGTPAKKKAPAAKKASGTGKEKPSDEQCLAALTTVVEDNPNLSVDEVKDLATDKLSGQDFKKTGLHNRLPKMVESDPRFEVKGGKVSLAKATA